MKQNFDVEEFIEDSPKLKSVWQGVLRKNLVFDGKISKEGEELLSFLSSNEEIKLPKKRNKNNDCNLWWSKYPSLDTFEYKGKKFLGTRALRVKKDDCFAKINKILGEGEYTISDLIGALEIEIFQKKENSYKTGQNKMSYFQNSLTYLNQRSYEPFIELYRSGHKIQETKTYTGVDI